MSSQSSHLPPPEQKVAYVRDLFRRIARRYDLMNRLMTFGRDQAWRRYTMSRLDLGQPNFSASGRRSPRILDVATGTGDLALEALHQRPDASVIGLDFVPEMLAFARQKSSAVWPDHPHFPDIESPIPNTQCLLLSVGDALALPFADGAFDGVATGFALRNVADIPAAFAEMARVTRTGGRVVCLEIAKPRTPLFRQLFALYFYRLVPLVGGWITGQRSAYTYLPHSLTAFLTPDQIASVMRQAGWRDVTYHRLMFGTVAVHVGVRA